LRKFEPRLLVTPAFDPAICLVPGGYSGLMRA
jgi:hypothetical protein